MIEKLRHEYRWSNHSMTGNSLGWGITATSGPGDMKILKELEKLAAAMPIPPETELTTQALSYSSACGYVRLLARQDASGEDRRLNKCVQITQYRSEDGGILPEDYFGREEWVDFDQYDMEKREIYERAASLDHASLASQLLPEEYLPEVFHAMLKSLLEKQQGLNIVIPGWKPEDFSLYTELFMLMFHKFLPEPLRQKAGYLSYTTEKTGAFPFYFSAKACDEVALNLSELPGLREDHDVLEELFLKDLTASYLKADPFFFAYQKLAADYIADHKGDSNLYGKLKWLYYTLDADNHGTRLPEEYLIKHLPELLYWGSKDSIFASIGDWIATDIHEYLTGEEDLIRYSQILLEGMTQRSSLLVGRELHWTYNKLWKRNEKQCQEQLDALKKKNLRVYTDIITTYYDEEGSLEEAIYQPAMKDLTAMRTFLYELDANSMKRSFREQVLGCGTELMNDKVFDIESYKQLHVIADRLDLNRYWVLILKNLLGQMTDQKDYLDDQELEAACYVEAQFNKLVRAGKHHDMAEERDRRMKASEDTGDGLQSTGILPQDPDKDSEAHRKKQILFDESSDNKAGKEEKNTMSFPSYILFGLPYGFLCGCAMYVARYTIMIGHWKIGVGMLGMLMIVLMNYSYTLLQVKTKYALWMSIGLVLVEGYVVKSLAFMNAFVNYRIYFFIALGALCLLIQSLNLYRLAKKKRKIGEYYEDKE